MKSFILACIVAVVLATIGALVLESFQKGVSVAFTTESARV